MHKMSENIYFECRKRTAISNDRLKSRAKEPMEAFLQSIDEWYGEGCYELERDLLETIKENWESLLGEYEEYEDFIRDWVWEHVAYKLPEEHYLDQSVCVNIIVDTGDGNHDFVLNDVYPHYNGRYGDIVPEEASVLWLVRQARVHKAAAEPGAEA